MFTLPHITKFVQTRKLLVLINEYNASYRQIFMDGRALPVDPQPSWNGYSTAKWEGDTLVVQTNGLRDDLWMDMAGTPLTNAATVVERLRRPNFGTLEIDINQWSDQECLHQAVEPERCSTRSVLDTELHR